VPKITAAHLAIDHVHCRAICDEIGERLGHLLKREVSDVPPNLLLLVSKLDELDRLPFVLAPSIVPSVDEAPMVEATATNEAFSLNRVASAARR
jgi:hypothetical protein